MHRGGYSPVRPTPNRDGAGDSFLRLGKTKMKKIIKMTVMRLYCHGAISALTTTKLFKLLKLAAA